MNLKYLIAYDFSDDSRRYALSELLLDFGGVRIQKSAFICELSLEEFAQLKEEFEKIVKTGDRLFAVPLCKDCLSKSVMRGSELPKKTDIII